MERARAVRTARGAAAATLATFVALLSHVSAGGSMPGWLGVIVPWTFSLLVCVPLAGRRRSVVRLSIGVVLSQALFHVLFVLGAGSSSGLVGVGHHGMMIIPGCAGGASAPGAAVETMLWGDAAMWTAHVTAVVLTIAALHRGESALRRLVAISAQAGAWIESQVLAMVRTFVDPLPSSPRHRLVPAESFAPRALRAAQLSDVVRRGPPHVFA